MIIGHTFLRTFLSEKFIERTKKCNNNFEKLNHWTLSKKVDKRIVFIGRLFVLAILKNENNFSMIFLLISSSYKQYPVFGMKKDLIHCSILGNIYLFFIIKVL